MNELIINNKDAFSNFGIRMGEGFLNVLSAPVPVKGFVENKCRRENGKTVVYSDPRVDEQDVTLTFTLQGSSPDDYRTKYGMFKNELLKGEVVLRVPALGETYRLTYLRSTVFAMNAARTFAKISVKFNEPNPANRT